MLIGGHDSPNLRLLAGWNESGSAFEVKDVFDRVVCELQIPVPSMTNSLIAYGVDVARQILDGCIPAKAGVHRLFELCRLCDHDHRFSVLVSLDDDLDSIEPTEFSGVRPDLDIENIENLVKEEAARFVEQMASSVF